MDFIPKPLSPETLRQVVREAVARKGDSPDEPATRKHQISEEAMSRARQAVNQGEVDEADFFLRLALPLGADSAAVTQLASEVKQLRAQGGASQYASRTD